MLEVHGSRGGTCEGGLMYALCQVCAWMPACLPACLSRPVQLTSTSVVPRVQDALRSAADRGDVDAVRGLIATGANVNSADVVGSAAVGATSAYILSTLKFPSLHPPPTSLKASTLLPSTRHPPPPAD